MLGGVSAAMKHITSRDNPLFKDLLRLSNASRGTRREEGRTVLDGVHLIRAYFDRFGRESVELIVKDAARGHPEIAALAEGARAVSMADGIFDDVAPVQSPVGVLALIPIPELGIGPPGAGFQVLIDGVQEPGNLGSILRAAAAAGARLAHLSPQCADPWSPRSLRGGMGAQFLLPIQEHPDLSAAARRLRVPIVACSVHASMSLFDLDMRGELAFAVGSEGAGISPQLLECAQHRIRIPMRPGMESLNAAGAATVCFYEWLRQQEAGVDRASRVPPK